MTDYIVHLQWPAMVVTVLAAWLTASDQERRRNIGFWYFLAGNVLEITWAWHSGAFALAFLQVALAAMNMRGTYKNRSSN